MLPEGGDALAAMAWTVARLNGGTLHQCDRLPWWARFPRSHPWAVVVHRHGIAGHESGLPCAQWLAACMQGDDPAAVLDPSLSRYIDTHPALARQTGYTFQQTHDLGRVEGQFQQAPQPSCSACSMAAHEGCVVMTTTACGGASSPLEGLRNQRPGVGIVEIGLTKTTS